MTEGNREGQISCDPAAAGKVSGYQETLLVVTAVAIVIWEPARTRFAADPDLVVARVICETSVLGLLQV